jgi:5-methylcytosine-specific restriction endonuclease McrA
MADLPHPDSDELRALVRDGATREVYRVFYENRDRFISMVEVRELVRGATGKERAQLDRRKRDLHPFFRFERKHIGGTVGHRLIERKAGGATRRSGINEKMRAVVLSAQRCAYCGRTPLEDGVKLDVDHKIPQEWGGSDEFENLQPLCEECNRGKKNLYADYDEHADKIRAAITLDEPHKRIGELLRAFGGDWVPSDLIGAVASSLQYQEDWQKRLRELRELGWDIAFKRERGPKRTHTYYRATRAPAWPEGPARAAIRAVERAKKPKKS